MSNRLNRQEKIEVLRKLIMGKISAKDLLPKIRLCIFEKEMGYFVGFVLDPPRPRNHKAKLNMVGNSEEDIVAFVRNQVTQYYPDHLFEWGTMHFEECERLRSFAEQEF